ncbi:uncharacterized protein EV420DRAFT_1487408 [Desarmillaria tabescens]|uniref:Uncharacterized protein n=1 Tax=Armillaria tabescens TaxID=1929756 RepID=A0AA39J610_ARMTA|nr:uncharacterized protein EV420DRAFT_1487408 [Desarmillaria tabescens]KAK0436792.1 hypothetical protein EV420DRAFT_1487408 [Desarmillaria tabescens]
MFFRILALLPLVSLATADPLVGRTDFEPLSDALGKVNTTMSELNSACTTFQMAANADGAQKICARATDYVSAIEFAIQAIPSDCSFPATDYVTTVNQAKDIAPSMPTTAECLTDSEPYLPEADPDCPIAETITMEMEALMDKLSTCRPVIILTALYERYRADEGRT